MCKERSTSELPACRFRIHFPATDAALQSLTHRSPGTGKDLAPRNCYCQQPIFREYAPNILLMVLLGEVSLAILGNFAQACAKGCIPDGRDRHLIAICETNVSHTVSCFGLVCYTSQQHCEEHYNSLQAVAHLFSCLRR